MKKCIMYSKDNASVKTSGWCIAQLAKMRIDPKFSKVAADVLERVVFHENTARQ